MTGSGKTIYFERLDFNGMIRRASMSYCERKWSFLN